ncbi:MAG: hypothetical protein IPK16_31180 [Anaerolineales bacterium]|nr:hypothetical protein [Anaerolineales bacterium]
MVETTGDVYIERLNEKPESVQNLVAGQSVSMAGEIMDEVRERTVTGDSAVEMIVRSILRRKPREVLPPPSEKIQRRAEFGRLPSDFIQEPKNGQK